MLIELTAFGVTGRGGGELEKTAVNRGRRFQTEVRDPRKTARTGHGVLHGQVAT